MARSIKSLTAPEKIKPKKKGKVISNLPRGPDGKPLPATRTRAGIPNRVTKQAKDAIAEAFQTLGGVDGLVKWARASKTNKAIFYSQIYPKLIPVSISGSVDLNSKDGAQSAEVLERILSGLLAERQERDQEAGLIIDNEPDRGAVPQLVISSSAGTKAA